MTYLCIKKIISYLSKNDVIDKALLIEPPFTDINDEGIMVVFPERASQLIGIIDKINGNASVA